MRLKVVICCLTLAVLSGGCDNSSTLLGVLSSSSSVSALTTQETKFLGYWYVITDYLTSGTATTNTNIYKRSTTFEVLYFDSSFNLTVWDYQPVPLSLPQPSLDRTWAIQSSSSIIWDEGTSSQSILSYNFSGSNLILTTGDGSEESVYAPTPD
jgi:hypothetical protein